VRHALILSIEVGNISSVAPEPNSSLPSSVVPSLSVASSTSVGSDSRFVGFWCPSFCVNFTVKCSVGDTALLSGVICPITDPDSRHTTVAQKHCTSGGCPPRSSPTCLFALLM
jgi:hypothetical protein